MNLLLKLKSRGEGRVGGFQTPVFVHLSVRSRSIEQCVHNKGTTALLYCRLAIYLVLLNGSNVKVEHRRLQSTLFWRCNTNQRYSSFIMSEKKANGMDEPCTLIRYSVYVV